MKSQAPDYVRISQSLRPIRGAVLLLAGNGWEAGALRMMEQFSWAWGGSADILVPWVNGIIPDYFWQVLRAFDADRFSYYSTTWRGHQLANPERFEAWMSRQAEKYAEESSHTVEEARKLLSSNHMMRQPLTARPSDEVESEIKVRLSPFISTGHVFLHHFQADEPPQKPFSDIDELDESTHLTALDDDGLDLRLQLLLRLRFGGIAPTRKSNRTGAISRLQVTNELLPALLEWAWAGLESGIGWERRLVGFASTGKEASLVSRADFFANTPLGHTEFGCGWARPWMPAWDERPYFVVVGDSGEDYFLAVALDRLLAGAAWLPYQYVKGNDDVAKMVRHSLRHFLWNLTSSSAFERAVRIVSCSLTGGQLNHVLRRMFPKHEILKPDPERVSIGDKSDLTIGPASQRLFCSGQVDQQSWEAFIGQNQAGSLAALTPRGIGSDAKAGWVVDVLSDSCPWPTRTALNILTVVQEGTFDRTLSRASSYGLTYYSRTRGFIPAGATLEAILARPRIRRPDATEIFERLLGEGGLRGSLSSVGRYWDGTLQLWGGLDAAVEYFSDGPRYSLLEAYRDRSRSENAPGVYLSVLERRFLSFPDSLRVTGLGDTDLRKTLDELLEREILERGLLLICLRCNYAGFYRSHDVGRFFTCIRCRESTVVKAANWKSPISEPVWYYALNEIVYQAVENDIRIPLLALGELKKTGRCLQFTPSMDVFRGDQRVGEVDLWAILDGRLILGEAKKRERLESTAAKERSATRRLVEIATGIGADEILLATAASTWRAQTLVIVRAEIANSQPRPNLRILEGLGT